MTENAYFYLLFGPFCTLLTGVIVFWLTQPSVSKEPGE